MKKILIILFCMVLLTLSVNALLCDSTQINKNYIKGSSVSTETLTCSNELNTSVSLSKFGSYFSIDKTSLPANSSTPIIISFDNSAPVGSFLGLINFAGYNPLPIFINVTEEQDQNSGIYVFPTGKVLTVQQGIEKTQTILVNVPTTYPRVVTVQSVDFNPGTENIKFGDLNLGQIQPGQSLSIPIVFSGIDAQVGTYQTNLKIFALDSVGQIKLPDISLTLQVTAGISPTVNNSSPPICSLTTSTFSFNQTYSLTCSNVNNNIEISVPYSPYFLGKSVTIVSGVYTYTFQPIKTGQTTFLATFSNNGGTIFSPFSQTVNIISGGYTSGSKLRVIYTPSLDTITGNQTVIMQLVENNSNSLVSNSQIQVNSIEAVNISSSSFSYNFLPNINYTVRGISPGYDDIVQNVFIQPKNIILTVNPSSGDSETWFNITSDINCTLYINGNKVTNPYEGYLSNGNNTLECFKEGYLTVTKNISVEEGLQIYYTGEFKKGVIQTFTFNKNVTVSVDYQKDTNSEIINKIPQVVSNKISFEPDKIGIWRINYGDKVQTYTIDGFDWNFKIWKFAWYWWALGIIFIIFIFTKMRKGSDTPYSTSLNLGAN